MISRRTLLERAALTAGLSFAPAWGQRVLARAGLQADPFTLGIASGDPSPDGMVLWTRLAPKPTQPDGGMPAEPVSVRWEVAEREDFASLAASGEAIALPDMAHSVHVEVGGLKPGRPYVYRFIADGVASPIGRTRTAPAAGADIASLRYAFCACQRYEDGFYAAYRDMVAKQPDLILFLGDYIYEQAAREGRPRRHPALEAHDIETYRLRYATYKLDPLLQAAHAAAPWMVIWDDHEVKNNYGGDHGPKGGDPAKFLARRAAAYKAYYEHMPVRRMSIPQGPSMRIYRALDWGRLAQFQFVDGRQYRNPPAGDDLKMLGRDVDRLDPARTMLGVEQERWLHETLKASGAQWNILAQQYVMAELRRHDAESGEDGFGADGWDAYPATRDRLLALWEEGSTRGSIRNPHAIGGDMHAFAASDLRRGPGKPVIAPAFVGGAISSPAAETARLARLQRDNEDFRFAESRVHGYTLVDVTPKSTMLYMRAVRDVTDERSDVLTLEQFVLEDGVRSGVRRA